jgi:hypothetical protein
VRYESRPADDGAAGGGRVLGVLIVYISEMGLRDGGGSVRAEARVTWEETDKPPITLFVETFLELQDTFWVDPNAFLVGCVLPAWHAGERRVRIDGTLCPVLCSNIRAVMATLGTWYPELGPPPVIEPSHGFKAYSPFRARAASFLSCGIDSLATLRWNKVYLPPEHPASIKGTILIDYLEAANLTKEEASNQTRKRLAAASQVTADVGAYIIPVRTNIVRLDDDGYFFAYKWHSAVMSFVAYFFSKHFDRIYIASADDATTLEPWGSHPLIDPFYSSGHLQIYHHGIEMSRLEKTALVAEWPIGLQNILVCQGQNTGRTNCGTCDKCIRTMTALLALGKLGDCRSFPTDDVSPELLSTVEEYDMIYTKYQANCYRELVPILAERGRDDLVRVIQQFLRSYAQKRPG